jgi:hypothetical protein
VHSRMALVAVAAGGLVCLVGAAMSACYISTLSPPWLYRGRDVYRGGDWGEPGPWYCMINGAWQVGCLMQAQAINQKRPPSPPRVVHAARH